MEVRLVRRWPSARRPKWRLKWPKRPAVFGTIQLLGYVEHDAMHEQLVKKRYVTQWSEKKGIVLHLAAPPLFVHLRKQRCQGHSDAPESSCAHHPLVAPYRGAIQRP